MITEMPARPDLDRLYAEHAQALFAFLLNLTRNEADTRDLLQEVFVKMARHPGILDKVRDARAFLLRLAHNAAIDLMRRHATRERNYEQLALEATDLFAPAPQSDGQELREALSTALADLPADQRTVVHLKLWEGLTFEQIAQILDIPANTAASRYRYGLDKLRQGLRPFYEELK